jgi:RNA polymerase sigma-70 factor, ECF subfamily
MEKSESEIIEQLKAGNYDSFGSLYEKYVKKIYDFLYYRSHHKETAEDLTSVVFTKALDRIGQYSEAKGKFSTWLYQIARNTLIDYFRTAKSTEDIETVFDLSAKGNIEVDLDVKLNLEKVKKYLASLPKEAREVVIMRVWDDLSYKEIAEILGKSEGATKMIFFRTMEKLNKEVALYVLICNISIISKLVYWHRYILR